MNNLTKRQHQLMLELVKGLPDKEIGKRLDITTGTVRQMLHNLYQRTGNANRTELAVQYIDHARRNRDGN